MSTMGQVGACGRRDSEGASRARMAFVAGMRTVSETGLLSGRPLVVLNTRAVQ